MNPQDIVKHRLINQHIAHTTLKTPAAVVASLTAMQAQDYRGALWAIGLRLPGATEADVERAVAQRNIVRTWPMRGTLHFVAAPDVRWMLKLLTPRILSGSLNRQRAIGLDAAAFLRCEKACAKALGGGKQLTREELGEAFARAGVPPTGPRAYHLFWRLGQQGVICFSSRQGNQPAFALLDEWVPRSRELGRDEALAELALRYFAAHGPATIKDFVWWSGLKVSDARAGIAMAGKKLRAATVEGVTFYSGENQNEAEVDCDWGRPHLLPGFDEYMLGYRDRSAALDPKHANKVVPGGNGIFLATMVLHGRIVGTWKKAVRKGGIAITHSHFTRAKKDETLAFEAAASRYAKFAGAGRKGNEPVGADE